MSKINKDLKGQTAIVTGATGNIGSAIAEALAQQGINIAVVDLKQDTADSKASYLSNKYGIQSAGYAVDITDDPALDIMMIEATKVLGCITILINNAGTHQEKPIIDTPFEEFRRVLDVNLLASWNLTRKVAPGMIEAGGGAIVNITSAVSFNGGRGTGGAAYIISKGGMNSLIHASARELGRHGIRVNGVAPGYITGAFYDLHKERIDKALSVTSSLKRPTSPEEIANTVVYLVSPASSATTGNIITVDGGTIMR